MNTTSDSGRVPVQQPPTSLDDLKTQLAEASEAASDLSHEQAKNKYRNALEEYIAATKIYEQTNDDRIIIANGTCVCSLCYL